MTIQRAITRPSTASVSRGRTKMPTLSRRMHYQAAEKDRESVQVVGSDGKDLSIKESLERMGGPDQAYTELLSDASVMESKCLQERHPNMDPDEVMRQHFAAQARHLEGRYFGGEQKIAVAIHQEVDGSYHAHMLLPDSVEGLKERQSGKRRELDGRNSAAQEAWDKAWREGRKLEPIRNATERADAKARQEEFAARLETLRQERVTLSRTLKEAQRGDDPAARWEARRQFAERATVVETERHEVRNAKTDHFFRARGMENSLEHLVERDREDMRHRGEMRQAENIRHGQFHAAVREQNRRDREPFKHMNAAERAKVREAGLDRELDVVRAKHAYQLTDLQPGSAPHEARVEQQAHEIEGILLRHEAGKLRDHENDLSRASGVHRDWSDSFRDAVGLERKPRPRTISNWAATYETRKKLMAQRHHLERLALHADAAGRGKEPSVQAVQKLAARHESERKALTDEPIKMGIQKAGAKVRSKAKALARGATRLPSKALEQIQKAMQKASKDQGKGPSMKEAEAAKGAVTQTASAAVHGAVKVATTVAVETAKAALHQAKHAAQAAQVTGKAIAVGLVNPLAGVKEAGAGYAKVGAEAGKTAAKDMATGAKNTGRDAAQATRDTAQQGLGALTSAGMNAAPQEVKVAVKTGKEAVMAAARTARAFVQGAITLNPTQMVLGTTTEAAKGGLAITKTAAGFVAAKLPAPVEKTLNLAARIPVLGLAAKALQLTAQVGMGVAKSGPEIDR